MKKLLISFAILLLAISCPLTGFAQYGVMNSGLCGSSSGGDSGGGENLLPTGPNPEEIPGSRADLRPDFDIYHTDGHEISSNCNDCPSEPVEVGQSIKTVLTAQVANNDVDNSLRDSDSNSIEGPIWWRIAGKTNWTLLVSEEFDVDDLNEDDEPDE